MANDITQVGLDNTQDVISELEKAFFDIPFENSDFQTEAFVIAAQITPERAYRAIGLRMHSKLQALQEAKFARQLEEIDIEELQAKIEDPSTSSFDRRRHQIEINKKLSGRAWSDKLINDAIHELNILYGHFKALPKYSREDFERGERRHFEQRLLRQVNGQAGAAESLLNMSLDSAFLNLFEQQVAKAPELSGEQLTNLVVQTQGVIQNQFEAAQQAQLANTSA